MDEVVAEAIKGELGNFETLANLAMGLAIVAGWAGISNQKDVELLSLKADRLHAFWLMAILFFVFNLGLLVILWRLDDLVALATSDSAIAAIAMNPWLFNPFAAHGQGGAAMPYDYLSVFALVSIWWVFVIAVFTVGPIDRPRSSAVWGLLMLLVGLWVFATIVQLHTTITTLATKSEPGRWYLFGQSGNARMAWAATAPAFGLAGLILMIRYRRHKRGKTP